MPGNPGWRGASRSRGATISKNRGLAAALLLGAALTACAPEFDDTRIAPQRGTLGEELYRVACERVASETYPTDVSGTRSRALCRGDAPPSSAPEGRLRALAENRARLVEALDHTLPAPMEDALQTLMVDLLPFYDPPTERLPRNTRALGDLLGSLMSDGEVTAALGRMSQRRGMQPPATALGLARPVLAYPALPELTATALAAVDAGGPLRAEWEALLEAAALEMATFEADDEDDDSLAILRGLLLRSDAAFGEGAARYVVERDARGLPVPAKIDGSSGFVDLDGDGLADVDERGRFVDVEGGLLDATTPFETADESGAKRDASGRALDASGAPLYRYREVERSLLAGLLREAPPLLDPADPTAIDLAHGALPLLGPSAERTETYGELELVYEGFDTSKGALFDVAHAGAELLREDETRDVLALLSTLLDAHEQDVVPLIESALYGDRVADATPGADLAARSELWDDVIRAATYMAQQPGMMEALLRALTDARAQRLGQVYAELMRNRDVAQLDPDDSNAPLEGQDWHVPVDRSKGNTASNQSLFQQSIAVIHELDGAELCNKQDAHMYMTLPDWLGGFTDVTALVGGPWDRCELMRIDNTTESYVLSILGRAEIEVNLGFVGTLLGWLDGVGIHGLSLDAIMERESGIGGLTTHPTPQAMNRVVYGEWNAWMTELLERPTTIDGDAVAARHDGHVLLAWERKFRFCGQKLLAAGQSCGAPVEEVSFYDAMTPLLDVFDTYDPREDGRFLFAELITAIHAHYPTAANTRYQSSNPAGPHYARADGAVTYEPIVAALLADCAWQGTGAARTCNPAESGHLVTRLGHLMEVLDGVEVRPGVDGIDVLAAAAERMIDPLRNPGLANRRGRTSTKTNAGTRAVAYTPLYLLLDALHAIDVAHAADAERYTRFLDARSRLVDLFLATEPTSGGRYRLANRRVEAIAEIALDFTGDRIAAHAQAGDLTTWARGLDDDLADALGSPLAARTIRFLDATDAQPETQTAFLELARYLLDEASPNDAFETLLRSAADALFLLEDDASLVPLVHALAGAVGANVRKAVDTGGAFTLEGTVADESLTLLHEVGDVDDAHTLNAVLRNAVTFPDGELETPLQVIADVIAEVNRAAPGAGGPLAPEDHEEVLGQVIDFLTDEDRGLERVYDVVQSRELAP